MNTDAYLESKVLSADAVGLINVLYDAALDCVRDAREHLATKDIAARSKAINKTLAIVDLLNASLDHGVGGDISRNLASLYIYIRQRLLEANLNQSEQPLAEVSTLLTTLAEAWRGIRSGETGEAANRPASAPAPLTSPWDMLPQQTPLHASAQRAWSL
jgi:flagellar protein FliS